MIEQSGNVVSIEVGIKVCDAINILVLPPYAALRCHQKLRTWNDVEACQLTHGLALKYFASLGPCCPW